ncbi:hypothetical protein L198_07447 [Cryptococcus wingfieldii CBS 7118]|uniref:Uncharacterized protein n=1 Tax=Cryptococcus wingfieldii CBS 7118 TaxID=1295528 RepID=A0A1E3IBA4_9TREE|nr:hypothetical protein L198_07447 [Cryptococcus wingfieldii CBS 7118]ODN85882.1 hypothetical protein L198_07447 [Cryptococcus wingfieldii CBS 7118]
MTHTDSTSPSLDGFGSPREVDVISLGSSGSSSSSASAETGDPSIPNSSPLEEACSGAKRYRCKPNKSAFPPPVDQYGSSNDEEAAQDSETRSTHTTDMVDEEKLAEGITNFLQQLKSDWASAKDQNKRIQELLEQQSKRLEEVFNKVLQQEAVIHREDTDGLITRVSQLETTLANLSNSQKQEVGRNQESTDRLVNRVAQLETTLANLTLQKTPPDIHVDVHMPPQESSITTAGDAPPRRSPHDGGSSDDGPQFSSSLEQSLAWTAGLLTYLSDDSPWKDGIMGTFNEAESMSQTDLSACREKICHLGSHLEVFAALLRHMGSATPQDAWQEAVAMKAVETLRRAL